jgi:superoxide reductase
MKKDIKFFLCKHCGNIITLINESGAPVSCCGDKMTLLTANTVDASGEKHLPVVTVSGNNILVEVGSIEHPMVEEHYIQWICLETNKGFQIKYLAPNEKPSAVFEVTAEEPVAVYEYCNLHGLWKTEIQ